MKKLIAIIVVLLMIFIGMYIQKQSKIEVSKNSEITIDEINQIETYLQKIYMWREVTGEALPVFNNVNEAPDIWLWEVVKKNLEEYELSYQQLQDKVRELFGNELEKDFPAEGYEYMEYNEQDDVYYALGIGLDNQEDLFLLDTIQKNNDEYSVQIVEYLEDYSEGYEAIDENYNIQIKNLNDVTIGEVKSTEEEMNIQQFVKDNINEFTKKEICLKKDEGGNLHIASVQSIN